MSNLTIINSVFNKQDVEIVHVSGGGDCRNPRKDYVITFNKKGRFSWNYRVWGNRQSHVRFDVLKEGVTTSLNIVSPENNTTNPSSGIITFEVAEVGAQVSMVLHTTREVFEYGNENTVSYCESKSDSYVSKSNSVGIDLNGNTYEDRITIWYNTINDEGNGLVTEIT